jgi:beta-galactosidase/beta-glucuronidase
VLLVAPVIVLAAAEIGANAIRMAHYQHDQKDYNLADERGLLLWAEIPLVDIVTDSAALTTSTQNQLRELIRQNYNRPSIAFWGIGNEPTGRALRPFTSPAAAGPGEPMPPPNSRSTPTRTGSPPPSTAPRWGP